MEVKSLINLKPEEILHIHSLNEITSMFPHWHCGYDKVGRPVIYKQYGKFDCAKLLKITSIGKMVFHLLLSITGDNI
jgi:hypothetical protein